MLKISLSTAPYSIVHQDGQRITKYIAIFKVINYLVLWVINRGINYLVLRFSSLMGALMPLTYTM